MVIFRVFIHNAWIINIHSCQINKVLQSVALRFPLGLTENWFAIALSDTRENGLNGKCILRYLFHFVSFFLAVEGYGGRPVAFQIFRN